ncbi:AI-2E family transporter [Blastococcus sp. Marseille-P5729]|uniref:AI-2E family transporter n=1 Tax=Blastococcus sp. Marseille-P5729 TaxID=2086582 RepID=UPI00131B00D0|nr:AI-2E family transporter [Blastococcus sp. Marseille-P5729]
MAASAAENDDDQPGRHRAARHSPDDLDRNPEQAQHPEVSSDFTEVDQTRNAYEAAPFTPRLPWPRRQSDLVTPSLTVFASWAWRFLLVIAAIWVFAKIIGFLATVTIPIAIALLLSALLSPAKRWMVRRRVPPGVAAPLVFVGGLVVVLGLISLIVQQFVQGAPDLARQAQGGLDEILDWLENGPFHISDQQLSGWVETAQNWIGDNSDKITTGALSTATSAGHVIAGFLLTLFILFFFLKDGAAIWQWVLRFVPQQSRGSINGAAHRSFDSLAGYVKATAMVALVDAIGIGIGLVILGVPLAIPLAALVFLTAFIPLVGATLSGAVAVLVALVTVGPVKALIALGIVIAVQQLESHLLQPILMGHAVSIHPLGVILAIAVGTITAGIVGALLAVPLAASLNAAFSYLYEQPPDPEDELDAVEAADPKTPTAD